MLNAARASLVAQTMKHLPATRETRVQSLGQEHFLEKEMATHSSIQLLKLRCRAQQTKLITFSSLFNVSITENPLLLEMQKQNDVL